MRRLPRLIGDYLKIPIIAALVVVAVSTVGYLLTTDLSVFDSFYMTIITVGTIGFDEIGDLGTTGRVWTMFVIVAGYGVLVGMTARFTSLLLSGTFGDLRAERRRKRMQSKLSDHIVVVGYGRVGRATVEAARRSGRNCAVIDNNVGLGSAIEEDGAVPVVGDARDSDTLEAAGLSRAASLVLALSDPDNLVVGTTARLLFPDLRIVARVSDMEWCDRLRKAGADDLVPVYRSAGQHLAVSATTSGVIGIMGDVGGYMVEEVEIKQSSKMLGMRPRDIMEAHPDVVVVGIRRENDLTRWHEVSDPIAVGDVVIVVGPTHIGSKLN